MLIPLIKKDPEANDFTCRDGEIDFSFSISNQRRAINRDSTLSQCSLSPEGTFPTATLRIPLQNGEKEKANLLLGGEISRVDPATAERLTLAIVQKAAQCLLDLSVDFRRQGLFILPFRFYTQTMQPDGALSYPTAQAIALPADFPPHPEIMAAQALDDSLTIAIRFPVRPHRLIIPPSTSLSPGHTLRTFISYPLYIPDPKEMRGSIGSVRSAVGGNSTGIRFAFLSSSAIKASVAAPEKYYELVGNRRTGYRMSSKSAPEPDYSCYADLYGYVPPFPRESMLALGDGVAPETDPMDWIADWRESGDGYLPLFLPQKFMEGDSSNPEENFEWPDGIEKDEIMALMHSMEMTGLLLTRPMALGAENASRRNATERGIRSMSIHGLSDSPALAILYGSHDGSHWKEMRRFDPRRPAMLLSPPRFWHRLLLLTQGTHRSGGLALNIKY